MFWILKKTKKENYIKIANRIIKTRLAVARHYLKLLFRRNEQLDEVIGFYKFLHGFDNSLGCCCVYSLLVFTVVFVAELY